MPNKQHRHGGGRRGISASLENYLEAIYQLLQQQKVARARDIAQLLCVSGASVTGALRSLASRNLINYEPYDVITLTAEGERVAAGVAQRHTVLKDFLVTILQIDEGEAEHNACALEHAISETVLDRLVQYSSYISNGGSVPDGIIKGFHDFLAKSGSNSKEPFVTVNDLKQGEKGRIVKIRCRGHLRKRLADMGAITGTTVEMLGHAPLGDPISVRLLGYTLSIRRAQAAHIELTRVQE